MDLHQTKLTKREWEILEIPVSNKEKRILKLICIIKCKHPKKIK